MSNNTALETFVNNVQTYSQQGNFTQLASFVSKDSDVLSKNLPLLDNALATFNIQEHSIGYLAILLAKFSASPIVDFDTLYTLTLDFIKNCNSEQVRYTSDLFAELCHKLLDALQDRKQTIKGILILSKAIEKIQLNSNQLTSIHADLCQACLSSKCLKPALQFLDNDIHNISKESGQFDVKYFLLYYYYGGMIYTAVKNFKRASCFFENAITTPSLALSHIMLEAYKKYVLVSLIEHGKVLPLPRYTSHVVTRYVKPLCQPYIDLSNSFMTPNQDLNALIMKHTDVYLRDQNMGLVKQCIKSNYKRNIQCLTKTFMTLSFTDMANRVQLTSASAAENYILNMIEDKEIYASINQRDGMVSFHDNPEKYNNMQMVERLRDQIMKCIALDNQLKEMDEEILLTPQYIQKVTGLYDEDGSGSSSIKLPHLM